MARTPAQDSWKNSSLLDPSQRSTVITGLNPYTEYHVTAVLVQGNVTTSPLEVQQFTTAQGGWFSLLASYHSEL